MYLNIKKKKKEAYLKARKLFSHQKRTFMPSPHRNNQEKLSVVERSGFLIQNDYRIRQHIGLKLSSLLRRACPHVTSLSGQQGRNQVPTGDSPS